ncbi:MAG: hypothetical protein LBP83_05090 [Dysgonamonadaceae bacterium]|jgi:hypothetical protein|nr:hypothetical protein [Dysgonamonadaceae bacterium]
MKSKKTVKKFTLASRIKKTLKEQGSYFTGLDAMIEITAGNMYAYFLIMDDVESLDSAEITEKTREGNDKKRIHPAIRELRDQSEMVRRCLRELRLTIATVEGVSDDDMGDLMDSVNSVTE